MPEKTKRKANPRRRTLMRLIIGIGLLVTLIAGAIQVLRPDGAEIVYIAPDENGVEQVWLVNLNNPDNPRQLTELNDSASIRRLDAPAHSNGFVFDTNDEVAHTLWYYDLSNNTTQIIEQEEHTEHLNIPLLRPLIRWELHPTSNRVAVFSWSSKQLGIIDVLTADTIASYPIEHDSAYHLQWISDAEIMSSENYLTVHDVFVTNTSTGETSQQNLSRFCAYISPDGNWCAINLSDGRDPIAPELVGISEIESSDEIILPIDWQDRPDWQGLSSVTSYFYGWHPNSEQFLISDRILKFVDDNPIHTSELQLHDVNTQEFIVLDSNQGLHGFGYGQPSFNWDGSQIVFIRENYSTSEFNFVHFNLETGEETILPIAGRNPQWVNGGR